MLSCCSYGSKSLKVFSTAPQYRPKSIFHRQPYYHFLQQWKLPENGKLVNDNIVLGSI